LNPAYPTLGEPPVYGSYHFFAVFLFFFLFRLRFLPCVTRSSTLFSLRISLGPLHRPGAGRPRRPLGLGRQPHPPPGAVEPAGQQPPRQPLHWHRKRPRRHEADEPAQPATGVPLEQRGGRGRDERRGQLGGRRRLFRRNEPPQQQRSWGRSEAAAGKEQQP
jgi:hypothetical protein